MAGHESKRLRKQGEVPRQQLFSLRVAGHFRADGYRPPAGIKNARVI